MFMFSGNISSSLRGKYREREKEIEREYNGEKERRINLCCGILNILFMLCFVCACVCVCVCVSVYYKKRGL